MAEGTGFYARLDSGVSVLSDLKISSSVLDCKLSSKAGFSVSGAAGYAVMPNLAFELESGYQQNNFDKQYDITLNGTRYPGSLDYPGHASIVPIIGSIVWSPSLTQSLKAEFGAGLGAAVVNIEGRGVSSSDTAFASQFRVGLSAAITQNVEANLGYRLRTLSEIEVFGSKVKENLSHIFSAGINFRF